MQKWKLLRCNWGRTTLYLPVPGTFPCQTLSICLNESLVRPVVITPPRQHCQVCSSLTWSGILELLMECSSLLFTSRWW